jgi:hypothetical protein
MAMLKNVFRFNIVLLTITMITAASAFSQPPGGGEQPQMGQDNQMGQAGPGGQMQGGPMGQTGQNPQSGNQTQQGQGQGFARGQGMQPEQMQAQISQRLKELLGSSNDEWKAIEPKVLKVYSLTSSQARGFQMRSLMMRANSQANTQANNQTNASNTQRASAGNRIANSASDKTVEELQTLLQNSNASNAQIKNKLTEVRNAREKTQEELAKAQKELRELLTLRQEAILVSVGLLE